MELNYLKDHLFDLINESLLLDIYDIIVKDRENTLVLILQDGSAFEIVCKVYHYDKANSESGRF